MNRKFMPDADFSSWTTLEYVAEWVPERMMLPFLSYLVAVWRIFRIFIYLWEYKNMFSSTEPQIIDLFLLLLRPIVYSIYCIFDQFHKTYSFNFSLIFAFRSSMIKSTIRYIYVLCDVQCCNLPFLYSYLLLTRQISFISQNAFNTQLLLSVKDGCLEYTVCGVRV